MSTCLLFPGLNGLLRKKDRYRYLDFKPVREKIAYTGALISDFLGKKIDLFELMEAEFEELYSLENVSLASATIVAIQSAIAEMLIEKGVDFDWVMGCSLGENAKTVVSGALSYDDAVLGGIGVMQKVSGFNNIGANIGLSTKSGRLFTAEDIEQIKHLDVNVTEMSPRFLNIGGDNDSIRRVIEFAGQKEWRHVILINFPAHSRILKSFVDQVADDYRQVPLKHPRIRVFSTFKIDEIKDPVEMREELLTMVYKPFYWDKSVSKIASQFNIDRFVNIGPCKSLVKIMPDINDQLEIVDSQALLV